MPRSAKDAAHHHSLPKSQGLELLPSMKDRNFYYFCQSKFPECPECHQNQSGFVHDSSHNRRVQVSRPLTIGNPKLGPVDIAGVFRGGPFRFVYRVITVGLGGMPDPKLPPDQ